MLDSSKAFQILKFVVPCVIFIWTLAYFTTDRDTYTQIIRSFKNEKKLFVHDFLSHEVDGQFDGTKIAELCAAKTWAPADKALILTCDPPPGGIGEVKNAHLHCIRIAIELGAQLVLPTIVRRSDTDIAILNPHKGPMQEGVPLSYFFDHEHLNRSLATYCPQMKTYSSINDLYNVPSLSQPVKFSIADLTDNYLGNTTVISNPSEIKKNFTEFITEKKPPKDRHYPLRLHLVETLYTWPTAADHPDFVRHFGRILRIREDVRLLAASALYNMQKRFNLDIDPRHGIKQDSFMGVHLRTEKDVKYIFPDYASQAANYLNYISMNKVRVVYLATGAAEEDIEMFRERARDFNATVVLKRDVLEGPELQLLDTFSWDQRALIDYEVMLRAGLVAGVAYSSFAWNLAMRRKNAYGVPGSSRPNNTALDLAWQDQYSTIFGNGTIGASFPLSIWP